MNAFLSSEILREELERRQRKNPAYSLRSFAQALEIKPGTLSNILAGKRAVPKNKASQIVSLLGLSPHKAAALLNGSFAKQKKLAQLSRVKLQDKNKTVLNETHHRILAEWEHFAVLSLMETRGFQSSALWISRRLGISKLRTEQVLKRLEASQLVYFDKNKELKRNFQSLTTSEDVVSAALQASHSENMKLATTQLQETKPSMRDYSSITMAIDPHKLAEAKPLIREFRQKLSAFLEDGERSSVYRLSIQLFPLTKDQNKSEDI